ncbi:deoxyribose-phosphate aldolase [Alkaliphilus metalliredigens QYMF]|uniref:Deoxyribose-phosphate aldolase n=1 Tax=Alkaliphilus metalliredigens (strain QYMF) TaxID=293826 RepID=A6TS79_ALKMQ|nr:deoxyribose-phosphate aldolase [Alkaliphilus metalliredigens]ABR49047.1 deoxyribose-phosphate aldolase [Alkaliphilus metalliredigens QYMF]
MRQQLSKYIDHTILKPETTKAQIKQVCDEARKHDFYSVCVNGSNVSYVVDQLKETDVKVTAVVGFPLGSASKETKAFETKDAITKGAHEIDMVINIGALKDKNNIYVLEDIQSVVEAAQGRAIVKVIIETCLLTEGEKVLACELSKQAGAHFVKTSTGFSSGGATVEDIRLMRETVGPTLGVKASGGVRDTKTAMAMIDAGATRIGASTSVSIVEGTDNQSVGY